MTHFTMSRSRKKTPVSGNTKCKSEKMDKRIANRILRRITKQAVAQDKEVLPDINEVLSVWEMGKDGKHYFDATEWPQGMRK